MPLWGKSAEDRLLDQIFNLKFTAKQLDRAAKKCEKDEKSELSKVKTAMSKGNDDGGRIHAQNAIRKKNEQLNYLKLASRYGDRLRMVVIVCVCIEEPCLRLVMRNGRLDAVVNRLETQAKLSSINKEMSGVVRSLDMALRSSNLEQVTEVMDKFEKQFEELDLQSEAMQSSIAGSTALLTPEDEVTTLMRKVCKKQNLNL